MLGGNSNNLDAHLLLGQLLMKRGERLRASNHFQSVLRLDPANASASAALGAAIDSTTAP